MSRTRSYELVASSEVASAGQTANDSWTRVAPMEQNNDTLWHSWRTDSLGDARPVNARRAAYPAPSGATRIAHSASLCGCRPHHIGRIARNGYPRSVRPLVALLAGIAIVACIGPPTEIVVALDTDVPLSRTMLIVATVARTAAPADAMADTHVWRRGPVSDSIRLPGTFGIVPRADGPRDEAVTLTIDAQILPLNPGEAAVTLRRVARLVFVPGTPTQVRIFLAFACATPSTDCTRTPLASCTVGARCEELDMTCGDEGRCVSRDVRTMPVDAGRVDAAVMDGATTDASDVVESDHHGIDTACSPNCAGRSCGGDGCGGSCGGCSGGRNCNGSGQCVCSGLDCGGSCVDAQTDNGNCGSCGNACTGGRSCSGGSCVCPGGRTSCGATCVDLQSDPSSCGSCGNVCAGGSPSCCSGRCANTSADNSNCGACGAVCASGTLCQSGSCGSCGNSGQPCCGTTCNMWRYCSAGTCLPCGAQFALCCPTGTSCNGPLLSCQGGSCDICGTYNHVCCPGSTCPSSPSLRCVSGTCSCIIAGAVCPQTGRVCCPGLSCLAGRCN